MCAFNFGYDVGTFGGVQAMNSFGRKFGEYDEDQERYALPGWLSSVMTATPFLGKAVVRAAFSQFFPVSCIADTGPNRAVSFAVPSPNAGAVEVPYLGFALHPLCRSTLLFGLPLVRKS